MSSTEFDDKTEEKRPTVQVGDPFTGKLLMEACLELMTTDSVVATTLSVVINSRHASINNLPVKGSPT